MYVKMIIYSRKVISSFLMFFAITFETFSKFVLKKKKIENENQQYRHLVSQMTFHAFFRI